MIYNRRCLLEGFLTANHLAMVMTKQAHNNRRDTLTHRHTRSRNLYQKLALMHETKIARFDRSAVFENFTYQQISTE